MVAVFFFGVNCFAQNESKFKSLKDQIAKNDVATQHPKKGIAPSTWIDRGKIFHDAYNVNVELLSVGLSPEILKTLWIGKEPKEVLSFEEKGVKKETQVYSQIKLNFEGGLLFTWEETETVVNNPLAEAVKAYQKATSLDEKGKNVKKINEAYKSINNNLETKMLNEYYLYLSNEIKNKSKIMDAYQTALQRIEVSNLLGFADTTYYYYAGYMAYVQSEANNNLWKESRQYLEKALSLGYKEIGENRGQIYSLLYTSCLVTGDSIQALKYAQTGFEKYPNHEGLMFSLINFYLSRGENHKTLEYLEQAVAKDPKNQEVVFARGRVLEELGEFEKSHAAYDAAIALGPGTKYFDSYYNKAILYHNTAVELMKEADKERVQSIYDAKMEKVNEEFAKTIPYLEKALEIKPDNMEAMDVLRNMYFRLRNKNPEYSAKYNTLSKKMGKEIVE